MSHNHGHNILILFGNLLNSLFTTSESWLLVKNMVNTTCLRSCQTTQVFKSFEIKKYQQNLKTSQNYSIGPSGPPKIEILVILARKSWIIEIELLSQQFFASNLFQDSFDNLVTIRPFKSFNLKLEQLSWKQGAKTCLTW